MPQELSLPPFFPSFPLFPSFSSSLPPLPLPFPQAMGHDLQPGLVFTCAVEAVKSVHKVYMNMQDLFNKFQSLVLPEAINYVLMEDESTLEMLEELANFRLTSYPNLPLTEALSRLAEDLLQATLKVWEEVEGEREGERGGERGREREREEGRSCTKRKRKLS